MRFVVRLLTFLIFGVVCGAMGLDMVQVIVLTAIVAVGNATEDAIEERYRLVKKPAASRSHP